MNFPYFLAKRITLTGQRTFSKLIVRITIGALALAIMAIILSMAVLRGFKKEVTEKQRGFFGDIWITKQDLNYSHDNTPFALDTATVHIIQGLPNVRHITPIATKSGIMKVNGEVEGVLLKGIDGTYDQDYIRDILVEGDTLDFSADNINEQIIISSYIANRLGLHIGDTFVMYFVQEKVRPRRFVVRGFYNTGSVELDQVYVMGSLNLIRRLNDLSPDQTGAYEVRVRDFERLEESKEDILTFLPIELEARDIIEQMPEIFNWLNMLDMNDNIIFVLMALVAVINMISALLISILERAPMIGVLKALGMTATSIRRVFLYNSMYLIGYGLLIGNLLTFLVYRFQYYTQFFKLDPEIYFIDYIPLSIGWLEVLLLNCSLIVTALLSLIIPSMLITRISPIKTIQFK